MKKFNLNIAALCGYALLTGAVVSLSSCSEEVTNLQNQESGPCAPVRVRISDLSISMGDFSGTRAVENPADYSEVDAITLAVYEGTTEVYQSTQEKGSATSFGDFSFSLPLGTYTMVVIGRDHVSGDAFSLTSATVAGFTSEKVRETFCAKQEVVVSNSTAINLNVTLSRIVTALSIVSTDNKPEGVVKIRTTYSAGGKTFNPSTGLAIENTGFSIVSTPSANVGQPIGTVSYAFLATDEQTMDITIEALDANDQVLITKEVENVPLKRNRKTTLTGDIFSPTTTAVTVRLETEWLTATTVNI